MPWHLKSLWGKIKIHIEGIFLDPEMATTWEVPPLFVKMWSFGFRMVNFCQVLVKEGQILPTFKHLLIVDFPERLNQIQIG